MTLPRNKTLGKKPTKLGGRPVVKKGDGPKKSPAKPGKKKGGAGGGAFFGGRGGYKGVPVRRVKRLVGGLMREETNDLRKQKREVNRDARRDAKTARTDYARGLGDLNYVHGETDDYISNLAKRNTQNQATATAQQQQAQAALQSMLGNTYSGAAQSTQSELARLGIQGGGNLGQLFADQANAGAVAAQSGANAQGTLDMAGQNAGLAMQMLQGMNQGSYTSGVGQNLNKRNDALSQVRDNRITQINEVRTALQEARGTRKDLFLQLLQQLQQTGWDQYVQQRQLGQQDRQINLQRRALNKK